LKAIRMDKVLSGI